MSVGGEREKRKKELFFKLQETNNRMQEIFIDLEKKELTEKEKEIAERGCLQVITETENFLFLKGKEWGKDEIGKVWESLEVWDSNSFLNDIFLLQKKAEEKEMTLLENELKLFKVDVRVELHSEEQKTLLHKIKKYIVKIRKNPLFH